VVSWRVHALYLPVPSMIVDIGDFCKNRRETPCLVKVGQFARRPKYVSLLPAILNHHKCAVFEGNVIRPLG
jgi:hypothetical protein